MAGLKLVNRTDEAEILRRRDIDRYGELDRQYQLWRPKEAELAALSKKLQEYAGAKPAEELAVLDGNTWQVQLGMRENKRTITNPKRAFQLLKKLAGIEKLIEILGARIPLKEGVDAYIPKAEHPSFLTESRTGTRKVIAVIPRQMPASTAS